MGNVEAEGQLYDQIGKCKEMEVMVHERDQQIAALEMAVASEKKKQEIWVEKGMTDRQRIVLAGEGDQVVRLIHELGNVSANSASLFPAWSPTWRCHLCQGVPLSHKHHFRVFFCCLSIQFHD